MRCFLHLLTLFALSGTLDAATIWVTDIADDLNPTNGTCNLREAILSAENDTATDACEAGEPGSDTIYFTKVGLILLLDGLPDITQSLRILGPGKDLLTINANGHDRVLYFEPSANLQAFTLRGVSLTGGIAPNFQDGGGVYLDSGTFTTNMTMTDCRIYGNVGDSGGGVASTGNLTMIRVTVEDNTAESGSRGGGGVYSATGRLIIRNSTISENVSESTGGGLDASSDAFIIRSTFSQNTADGSGGAIYYSSPASAGGTLTVRHSTITQNWANGAFSSGAGGALRLSNGDFVTENSIFSSNLRYTTSTSNTVSDDIDRTTGGTSVTSDGFNLIGNNTTVTGDFPAGMPNANNDHVGTNGTPLLPGLNALLNNGGPTKTHAPNPGAYVIGKGSCDAEPFDQRGYAGDIETPSRKRSNCEIGAVERSAFQVPLELDITMYLAGADLVGQAEMRNELAQAGVIPSAHPYSGSPWNHPPVELLGEIPSDMVDWVLVKLYAGGHLNPGGLTNVFTKAMVLHQDFTLTDPDKAALPVLLPPGPYYVGVDHRNHLPDLSMPVYLDWTNSEPYTFAKPDERPYWAGPVAKILEGNFLGLIPGDANADGEVNAVDVADFLLPIYGDDQFYVPGDFNLDSETGPEDATQAWVEWNGKPE
ncbi:MAG: choice-of-anchor Q domain-containing protein [Planctomycetota bacterium]